MRKKTNFPQGKVPTDAIEMLRGMKNRRILAFKRVAMLQRTPDEDRDEYAKFLTKYPHVEQTYPLPKPSSGPNISRLDDYLQQQEITKSQLFAQSWGPACLTLDNGHSYGFEQDRNDFSVIIWDNYDPNYVADLCKDRGNEMMEIDCCDKEYSEPKWCDFLGAEIEKITILKAIEAPEVMRYGLPNEKGIRITTKSGKHLIFSRDLLGETSTFLIIQDHEIRPGYEFDMIEV